MKIPDAIWKKQSEWHEVGKPYLVGGKTFVAKSAGEVRFFPFCPHCGALASRVRKCGKCGRVYRVDWENIPTENDYETEIN